jgi:2-keto-3-deoxy-L-rhamnonate aldolase RhmA
MSAAGTGVPAGPSPLDRGRLRARLAAGQATVGTFVGAASPVTAEACAAAERLAEGWSFVAIGSDATLLAATELARARPSTPDLRGGQT